MRTIFCFVLATICPISFSAEIMGRDLLVYFQANCKSQNEGTRRALADSQALVSILENIKNDLDCVTAAGSISQLNNLQNKINTLQNNQFYNVEIEKIRAQEMEVQSQLASVTDPVAISELQSILRELQVQKAGLISQENSRNRMMGGDLGSFLSNIIVTTNSVFTSITANQKCLQKNSNLLTTVTSLVGSMGSALMTVNPALGLGLAAGSDFLGVVVEGTRKAKYNRKIRRVSEPTLALQGYKCAMESLSDRWCQLKDAREYLDFVASMRRSNLEEGGLKNAVRLFERDIPVVLNWLERVRTGVPASNSSDSNRQSSVFEREEMVKSADARGNGFIKENQNLYDAEESDPGRWSVLRGVVAELAQLNCDNPFGGGGSGNNPLFDIFVKQYAPYYLIGLDKIPFSEGQPINFCLFDPFTQWPTGSGLYTPNYDLLKKNYRDWIDRAWARVRREMTLILQPDALQVLTTVYERTANVWKYAAIDSYKNIINFLVKNRPKTFVTSAYEQIYNDTEIRLKNIIRIISEAVDQPAGFALNPKEALEKIFEEAQLQFGIIVLQSRLEMVVRISLDHYFQTIDPKEQDVAAQFLVSDSFISTLSKVSGTEDLTLLSLDNRNAQSVSLSNLNEFGRLKMR